MVVSIVKEINKDEFDFEFVGDQAAKIQILANPDSSTLQFLFDISSVNNTVPIQNQKLDALLSLLNINDTAKDELGTVYLNTIEKLYRTIDLQNSMKINSPMTNYKLVKLLNLCTDNCSISKYPHSIQMRRHLVRLSKAFFYSDKNKMDSNDVLTLIELTKFFLLSSDSDPTFLKKNVISSLELILIYLADKYSRKINFKYIVRIKNKMRTENSETEELALDYSPIANKGLEAISSIPNAISLDDILDQRMLSNALALYSRDNIHNHKRLKKSILWGNPYFEIFILSLLRSSDINLKCSAISFLKFSILDKRRNSYKDKQLLSQLLPQVIDSFNFTNLPWWYDPFEVLIDLLNFYNTINPMGNPVLEFIKDTNFTGGLVLIFFQCLVLKTYTKDIVVTMTKFIKLFAAIASFDENYRIQLLDNSDVIRHLEFAMDNHVNLLNDFISKRKLLMEIGEDLPQMYDAELIIAWLSLLKSFSRSITALRTSLTRNKLTELSLNLVNTTYQITHKCYFAGKQFSTNEMEVLSTTLGIICNFVVEFSSLQSLTIELGIIDRVEEILTDPLFNPNIPWNKQSVKRRDAFRGINVDKVKTNALWVLRHLMYNCQNSEKLEMLSKIPIDIILDFINDPSWPVQEQCFQLIRNLTCNSRKIVNILLEKFKHIEYVEDPNNDISSPIGSTYLFEFLAKKMKLLNTADPSQRKTLEAILYIIVNLAAVNENKKRLVIEQDEILEIIYEILSESDPKNAQYGNDSNLKLACLWVLNNLLWNSNISQYLQYASDEFNGDDSVSGSVRSISINRESSKEPNLSYSADKDDYPTGESSATGGQGNSSSDEDEEFIHQNEFNDEDTVHSNPATIERCKKLIDIGMYDLVKVNIFDEALNVREKARTLLYHMDLLRKEMDK
ncbi:hypothetical protein KAFR_0A02680 [Kazachstania africana CBS 2517]|uniref:Uncharacterized protein n=1 Tax=Kazachstania africana (strain ATCC 22294 / BCRC 22015 / CBS 2517 / CECT 1963 / NBRC 1671 / NRRL Y-8276) TaxID=1071382 RepID=H2AMV4_KAZAF|nr:hypothetical protein KAFR_0A02680 [Kazachstania africana CBS 2517]CCF55704.1 hypothetical protein KAFR_0A02680 [Kazachstania africana CBS 2517]